MTMSKGESGSGQQSQAEITKPQQLKEQKKKKEIHFLLWSHFLYIFEF
jgi:hypothetical protein